MHRTKIAESTLLVIWYAAEEGFDVADAEELVARAEQIARGRHSHVLGVRHLVQASQELRGLAEPAMPEARAGTPEVAAPGARPTVE
jgi:hypothetical protein